MSQNHDDPGNGERIGEVVGVPARVTDYRSLGGLICPPTSYL